MSLSYILPKCAKTREPKGECCVLWCTYISDNIHNPIPLDNLKNHAALLYITIAIMTTQTASSVHAPLKKYSVASTINWSGIPK